MIQETQQTLILFIIFGIILFLFMIAVGAAILNINITLTKILKLMRDKKDGSNSISS